MMNDKDPHIARMHAAGSDAERALVLLEAPMFTLMRLRDAFTRACRHAAFDEGVDYLDAWHDALSGTRVAGGFRGSAHEAARMPLVYLVDKRAGRPEPIEP